MSSGYEVRTRVGTSSPVAARTRRGVAFHDAPRSVEADGFREAVQPRVFVRPYFSKTT